MDELLELQQQEPGARCRLPQRNQQHIFHKFLRTLVVNLWLISSYCTTFSVRTGRFADGRLSRLSAGFTWDLDLNASWQASRKSCVKQIMSEEVRCCRDDQRSARSLHIKDKRWEQRWEQHIRVMTRPVHSEHRTVYSVYNTVQYLVLPVHCWAAGLLALL